MIAILTITQQCSIIVANRLTNCYNFKIVVKVFDTLNTTF